MDANTSLLYHTANELYNVGDIIPNTYFRAFIKSLNENNRQREVEEFFEWHRPKEKVSRLDSVFAFNNLTQCQNYAVGRRKFIYVIEPTKPNQFSIHNFKVISYFLGINKWVVPDLEDNVHLVKLYWQNFPDSPWIDHVNVPIYYEASLRRIMGPNWNEDQYVEEILIGCPVLVKEVYTTLETLK